MEILSGHLLQELLYSSPQTRIYRGIRLLDGLPVIVKILNQPHPSAERRARFEQEYRLMQRLQIDAIATAYSIEKEQGQLAIIMEDFGGESLNKLDIAGKLPLDEWLRLAIHIAQRLGQLHAKQMMHKDINPSNIVWNRDTGKIKLIDLGIATELVHEVAEPRPPDRLEGKFDQFQRDIPYRALTQAFSKLIRQILTEPRVLIEDRKDKLLAALGSNAQIIIDVIPDLALLIGEQPAVINLPPARAQNRFHHEFRKFVSVFATAEHPLVIFIDDLQWADAPSLQLLSLLLRPPALPYLLLIGAYRENEVTTGHALTLVLDDMQKQGVDMQTLTLPPLPLEEVGRLLCDTLHAEAKEVTELAQLCLAKTGGNPFFLNQFLMALARLGMLRLDAAYRRWRWDIERIREADITENVVELMVAKLRMLPEPTQRILQGAACLGNRFDLKMLAMVCGLPEADAAQLLWPALMEEVVVPLDAHYRHAGQTSHGPEQESAPNPRYRFLHDRVHQAATLLSDEAERAAMHLAIGRLWLRTHSAAEQQELLFDLVNHLNFGRGLIEDAAERRHLAQLNLQAARSAKASVAYKSALAYLEIALELVEESDWQRQYELMFSLHREAAEAAYLSGDFAKMQRYLDSALAHTPDVLDQAKLQEIRIDAYTTQHRWQEAIAIGLTALRLLGMPLPRRPTKIHVLLALLRAKRGLAGKSLDELASLPEMTDPRMLAATSVLNKTTTAVYYSASGWLPLFVLQGILWSLKYGYGPVSGFSYAGFSMLLGSIIGDIAGGARYGELALRLHERPGMKSRECQVMTMVHGLIQPWSRPLHDALEGLVRANLYGMETGDLEFSGKAAYLHCMFAFSCGQDLFELERRTAEYVRAVGQMQGPSTQYMLKLMQQGMLNLTSPTENPSVLQGAIFDAKHLQELRSMRDDGWLMTVLFSMALILYYLRGDHGDALANALEAEDHVKRRPGSYSVAIVNFYGSLTRLALADTASLTERRLMLHKVKKNQRKMQRWAKHAPTNFLHKWHLVEAELARVAGDNLRAINCYDQAVLLARENRFPQEEALAQELAGRFHLAQGREVLGMFCLRGACQSYGRWGAVAKVRDLGNRYSWLAEQDHAPLEAAPADITASSKSTSTDTLDWATAMRASQALSQELTLDRLLKRMIEVGIENTGAQRGMLLLKKGDDWTIKAEKSEDQPQALVLQAILLDESNPEAIPLPMSLVRYVERTRNSMVIHEAADNEMAARDPYVQQYHPRSLLLLPIPYQGELRGMLYLEHNTASGAFTESRLQLLELLASQASISLENASLYADKDRQIAELRAMALHES